MLVEWGKLRCSSKTGQRDVCCVVSLSENSFSTPKPRTLVSLLCVRRHGALLCLFTLPPPEEGSFFCRIAISGGGARRRLGGMNGGGSKSAQKNPSSLRTHIDRRGCCCRRRRAIDCGPSATVRFVSPVGGGGKRREEGERKNVSDRISDVRWLRIHSHVMPNTLLHL